MSDVTLSLSREAYKEVYKNGTIIFREENFPYENDVFKDISPIIKIQVVDYEEVEDEDGDIELIQIIEGWKLFQVTSITLTHARFLKKALQGKPATAVLTRDIKNSELTLDTLFYILKMEPINMSLQDFNKQYGKSKSTGT